MGRRKIEIKAIKDERNRSVTFLKRKGGLFKKAHELSVLCSVEVAVVIFGQNKKLFEYSSGDIHEILRRHQYYGNPHEHKGPSDFAGKGGGDEDDEDDDNIGSPGPEETDIKYEQPYQGPLHHPIPGQPGMQHISQAIPAPSPPMPNGAFSSRLSTPQPKPGSRPHSRTHSRRPSSNLAPQSHVPQTQPTPQPQAVPMGYNYQPNASYYQGHPPQNTNMQMQPHQQGSAPLPQQPFPPPSMSQHQMQSWYFQDQRRQSMPSNFPLHGQQIDHGRPSATIAIHSPPQPPRPFQSPTLPEPRPLNPSVRSHSIYTPVDDNRSILAQHWGVTGPADAQRNRLAVRTEGNMRSQSIDVGSAMRNRRPSPAPPLKIEDQDSQSLRPPLRTASTSGIPSVGPPPRTPSMSSTDVKRPRLKVQIPNEQSEAGSVTGSASPVEPTGPNTKNPPAKSILDSGHNVIKHLPPPQSPSASAILSAGPTGPKNPFARPPPPSTSLNNNSSYKDVETPKSALPSRFIYDGLLPSPSTFYPEWGLGSNSVAPSPQIYQPTPINMNGPSFRDDDFDRKRKPHEESDGPASKREKTR